MSRRPQRAWEIKWEERCNPPIAYVRFRWGVDERTGKSKRHCISTGMTEAGKALDEEADRIYAEVIAGRWYGSQTKETAPGLPALDVTDLTSAWLAHYAASHPNSEAHQTYGSYVNGWLGFFGKRPDGTSVRPTLDMIPGRLVEWQDRRLT